MEFLLLKASDWKWSDTVTINTIEDLQAIAETYQEELIVDFKEERIWIYDDYME